MIQKDVAEERLKSEVQLSETQAHKKEKFHLT